jgi:hypothetical protein
MPKDASTSFRARLCGNEQNTRVLAPKIPLLQGYLHLAKADYFECGLKSVHPNKILPSSHDR